MNYNLKQRGYGEDQFHKQNKYTGYTFLSPFLILNQSPKILLWQPLTSNLLMHFISNIFLLFFSQGDVKKKKKKKKGECLIATVLACCKTYVWGLGY